MTADPLPLLSLLSRSHHRPSVVLKDEFWMQPNTPTWQDTSCGWALTAGAQRSLRWSSRSGWPREPSPFCLRGRLWTVSRQSWCLLTCDDEAVSGMMCCFSLQRLTGTSRAGLCPTTGGMSGLLSSGRKTLAANWECMARELGVSKNVQVGSEYLLWSGTGLTSFLTWRRSCSQTCLF